MPNSAHYAAEMVWCLICGILFLQYDFISWMPNTPVSLERPPPSRKGEATEATLLDTFPTVDNTVNGMAAVWLLSKQSSNCVGGHSFVNMYLLCCSFLTLRPPATLYFYTKNVASLT
ncbi:hypothetical protein AMECASPLE_031809 [Ameca splendens]|uniref:Lipoxygenase domain-containing protein n=1 Tax=Ameca splendens TaxID=208324 RepID=A0ABV1ACS6_9TELE